MAAHRTNILHKMINVNFTINEINKTLSVEPLHDFQDNGGRGYFYIWSPRQRMGSHTNGHGFMLSLHKYNNTTGKPNQFKGCPKPKYCIDFSSKGVHTIPLHASDMGSPHSQGGGQPSKPNFTGTTSGPNSILPPAENFPNNIVRGDHGFDATAGHSWWWMYRYEWEEQGVQYVDTITSERGVGGLGSRYHRGQGYGHPLGKCGCYTYPVIQNDVAWANVETLLVRDITRYSVTCGGETKNKEDIVNDPDNGVGDEYKEGIVITRPVRQYDWAGGLLEYKNKWKMFYPQLWPESVPNQSSPNYGTSGYNYMESWDTHCANTAPVGYYMGAFPATIPGSSGSANNVPWYNLLPERSNISQIARSNTEAWNRIDEIENHTGVKFERYQHSLIQTAQDSNGDSYQWQIPVHYQNTNTKVSSTPDGSYPMPTQQVMNNAGTLVTLTGWTVDITQLAAIAIPQIVGNYGALPPGHPWLTSHPLHGTFNSRIYGIVKKSSTLDICGTPQVGPGNPDKLNLNWRNDMFDTEPYTNGPYNAYYGPHVHGVGGTSFSQAGPTAQQKNGGRGSISRFMSTCAKPWNGDPLRTCTFTGGPTTQPDITHFGSRPDYTALPAKNYIGSESWKWDNYDSSGYTTTASAGWNGDSLNNSAAWPSKWPNTGHKMRNWIGHINNASGPYWQNQYGIPIDWSVVNLVHNTWTLNGTDRDANDYNSYWSYGGYSILGSGQVVARNRFCLPSIKELDSPSYFNHIVRFQQDEDSVPDYGLGNGIHSLGYDCVMTQYGPACQNVQAGNPPGPYATYTQCHQQCNPWGTI